MKLKVMGVAYKWFYIFGYFRISRVLRSKSWKINDNILKFIILKWFEMIMNGFFFSALYLIKVNKKHMKNYLSDLKIIWYVRISRFSRGTSGRGGNEAVKRWPLNIAFPPKYNFPDKGVCISRRNQNDFPLNHLNLQCSTRRMPIPNQIHNRAHNL